MAIDTQSKRKSAITRPGTPTVPLPSGGIDAAARAELAGVYSGFWTAAAGVSELYVERTVWTVRITLRPKGGGTAETFEFAEEYWASGALYGGSGVIYPLLARPPVVQRAVNRVMSERSNTTISLYGKTHFTGYRKSLFDLADRYEWYAAPVEVRAYFIPQAASVIHNDDINIRMTAQVTGTQWDGDVLQVSIRDTFFEDKTTVRQMTPTNFPNADPAAWGAIMPMAFGKQSGTGNEMVVPCFWADVATNNPTGAGTSTGRLLLAHTPGSKQIATLSQLYVENKRDRDIDDRQFVPVRTGTGVGNKVFQGLGSLSWATSTSLVLDQFSYGKRFTTDSQGEIITYFGCVVKGYASSENWPDIIISLNYVEQNDAGHWTAIKNIFRIPVNSTPGATLFINHVFVEPLLLLPNRTYELRFDWNHAVASGPVGPSVYRTTVSGATYNLTETIVDISHHSDFPLSKTSSSGTSLNFELNRWWVNADSLGASGEYAYREFRGDSSNEAINWGSLNVKALIRGIADDASGTFTGTPNNEIGGHPCTIAHVLLRDPDVGLGLSASAVDATTFTSSSVAKLGIDAEGLTPFNVVLLEQISIFQVLDLLLTQARMVLYKDRKGVLKLHWPSYRGTDFDFHANEGLLRDELRVRGYQDNAVDSVTNKLRIASGPDPLNLPKDPEIQIKLGGAALSRLTEWDTGHETRGTKISTSQGVHGVLEQAIDARFHPAGIAETGTKALGDYQIDRYAAKQRRAPIRVPILDWYAADVFATLRVAHRDLPFQLGTSENLPLDSSGARQTVLLDGVPAALMMLGALSGEVVAIEESGEDMFLTLETWSPF